jgi:hypothetical protein
MVPQDAGRHGAPRPPAGPEGGQFLGIRQALQLFHTLHGQRQRQITQRPGIGPAQHHQQVNLGRPGANAFDADEHLPRLGVIQPGQAMQLQASRH